MKKNLILFLGLLGCAFALSAQYPLYTITQLQQPGNLAACRDSSLKNGDTVRVRGVVMMNGNQARVGNGRNVWIQDGTGPYHGLDIFGASGGATATTDMLNLLAGDSVEITGVVLEFLGETELVPLPATTYPTGVVKINGNNPVHAPAVVNIGDLNDANRQNQLVTGEQWEGSLVELRDVTVDTLYFFSGGNRVSFDVVDAAGNRINVSDRFLQNRMPAQGGTFVPPAVGDKFCYIRGIVLHSKNVCPGFGSGRGYEIHPFAPSHYSAGTEADFSYATTTGSASFTNLSVNASSLLWDFGDGATSTQTNPTHNYGWGGNYSVCLIAYGPNCNDTICVNITVPGPVVPTVTISQLQQAINLNACNDSSVYVNDTVRFRGVVVNNGGITPLAGGRNVWIQDGTGPYSGVSVWSQGTATFPTDVLSLVAGDSVEIVGVVHEFLGETEIFPFASPTISVTVISSGNPVKINPVAVSALNNSTQQNNLQTGEQWEGSFIELSNVTVDSVYYFSGSTRVGLILEDGSGNKINVTDRFYAMRLPGQGGSFVVPAVGTQYCAVKGILYHSKNNCPGANGRGYEIAPFDPSHFVLAPVAAFSESVNLLAVNFTNSSTGANSYAWNFGDGQVSSQQNPSHTYTNPGTYTVCVIATNTTSGCSDTTCHGVTVVCPLATAGFASSSSQLTASFTNQTTGTTTGYFWDFGDGGNSTQTSPSHTYASPGTYTVCLTASNSCGSDSICHSVVVTCPLASAGFTSTSNQLTASFTNQTTGTTTGYFWDFGDGGNSTQTSPSHTYASPGTYTVCLTATNSCGTDSSCAQLVLTCAGPQAGFTAASSALVAQFVDQSTNSPTSWAWDFGDGATSNQQNPTHTYAQPGTYPVCLVASSQCGMDTTCMTISLGCSALNAAFIYQKIGNTVFFSDLSSGQIASWFWDFGDGSTANTMDPQHAFSSPCQQEVCLVVTDSCGATDTLCQTLAGGTGPAASFSYASTGLAVSFQNNSSGNSIFSWNWTFGDGNSSSNQQASHTYLNPGTYAVCLTATDSCGTATFCDSVTVDTLIGIAEPGSDFLEVYPNPTSGKFQVKSSRILVGAKVEVFDLNGQLMLSHPAKGLLNEIDLSGHSKGIYFVRLQTPSGTLVRKIVLQ
ncbi:MAG: PKD domain-containing protein [Bacteroidia bacterium]|nr:PKD domain-containing protein [Bacteroidia bacterium]